MPLRRAEVNIRHKFNVGLFQLKFRTIVEISWYVQPCDQCRSPENDVAARWI